MIIYKNISSERVNDEFLCKIVELSKHLCNYSARLITRVETFESFFEEIVFATFPNGYNNPIEYYLDNHLYSDLISLINAYLQENGQVKRYIKQSNSTYNETL